MNKEEFIEKIKEIKINTPNKEFFLEYNECVYDILDENENLKKENQELKSRIDKAVQWLERGEICIDIRKLITDENGCTTTDFVDEIELLKILKGDSDE